MREPVRSSTCPELDHYIVTRYDDIERVLLDRDTWSASNASSPLNPVCPAAQEVLTTGFKRVPTLNNADPPRHGPMRKAVLACMTPRRLNALEPTLRAYAEDLVESFRTSPSSTSSPSSRSRSRASPRSACSASRRADTDQLKEWSRTRVLLTYGRLSEDEQVQVAGDVVGMWQYVEAPRRRTRAKHPPTTSRATCCATPPRSPTW